MIAIALAGAPATAQQGPFDPKPYLDEAIAKAKAMSYKTRDVDWAKLQAAVHAAGKGAKDQIDLLPAYQMLVEGLADGHSLVIVSPEDRQAFKARFGREFDGNRSWKQPTSSFTQRRQPEARSVQLGKKQAELLVVPKVFGGGERAREYARTLYAGLKRAAPASCGYIVDLRGNQGGNVWPMTVGVGPLLGEGWRSFERDRDGRLLSYARLERGAAVVETGEQKGMTIIGIEGWSPLPKLHSLPVAVLIDDAVGSSGEGMAVAFKGRPDTRFFGEKTSGVASSNEGFMIDDRINLVVTTAMIADRNGATYPDGVAPDEVVPFGAGRADDPDDAQVEAAKRWLQQQGPCRITRN